VGQQSPTFQGNDFFRQQQLALILRTSFWFIRCYVKKYFAMKHISLLSFVFILSISAKAQEVVIDTNYYNPPPVVRRRVLVADPEQNIDPNRSRASRRAEKRRELFDQLDEVQTWHVSAEAGFRSDVSRLDNTLNRLVSNPTQTKAVGSLLVGYTYRNAWSLETGYSHAPTHLTISIANGSKPLVFTYQNMGVGIPLRIKRRIGAGNRAANGTGFWLTGGAWLMPNGTGQTEDFDLIGYTSRGRNRTDTIRLTNSTMVANRLTGLAELGIYYTTRLSAQLEMGFFLRKYWGLGQALQSEILYSVNNASQQKATVTADGSGWGFGLSLRYVYGRQYDVKKSKRINLTY
jgi:hypothetical protein